MKTKIFTYKNPFGIKPRAMVLIVILLMFASLVTPALAAPPALDGEGTMSVSPTNVTYGSTGNTFTFTFTANIGDFGAGSQVALTIPNGWTLPTTAAGAGHVSVASGTCTLSGSPPFGITDSTIFIDMASCTTGQFFTVTYAGVPAPAVSGSPYTFLTQTDIGPGGEGLVNITAGSPTVTVDPIMLTVSAAGLTPQSRVYDGTTDAVLVIGSPTLVGVRGGDSVSLVTGGATGVFADKNIGTAKTVTITGLTLSGASAGNYALTEPTRSANITKKPITVTAVTGSKTYDGTTSSSGVPTLNIPLAFGDTVTWTQTFNNRNVGTGKTITPAGTVNDNNSGLNYSYTFTPITTGIINARSITVTATTDSKTYDGSTSSSAVPTLSPGTPLGANDTEPTWTQIFDTKTVGTNKTLTPAGKVIDGNGGLNYSYNFAPVTTGAITAKPVTVTAAAKSKTYGAIDPALTYTVSPALITGDSLSGELTRVAGSDVGVYAITQGTLGNSNYEITYTGANLSITKATLTVTADNQTINIGEADPFFSFGYSGFMNSETSSVIDTAATCEVSVAHTLPGTYFITCAGGSDNNYDFSYVNGKLTVTAIPTLLAPGVDEQLLSNASVTFDWADIATAVNYTIQVASNNNFSSLLINKVVTAPTSLYQANLPANKTLFWRVRSFGPYGTSDWAPYRSFITANPPSIPTLVAPALNALVTMYNPVLDWNNSSTPPAGTFFGRYRIQIATNATFTSDLLEYTTNETIITESSIIPIPDLNPNTKYYWRVRSENTLNQYSGWSTIRYFRTALPPPALVSPVEAFASLELRPVFDWSDVAAATGYTIQISKNTGFTSIVHTGNPTSSEYTTTADMPKNLTLFWRVRTNGTNGPSGWSEVRSFNSANSPTTPALFGPPNNSLSTDYIPMYWWGPVTLPAGTSFKHFQFQLDDNADFSSPKVDYTGITNPQGAGLQYLGAMEHNTKFYWRVRGVNTDNEVGNWSAVWAVRMAVDAPILISPNVGFNALTLRPSFDWDVPSGPGTITGYTIQISKNNTFTQVVHTGNPSLSEYTPIADLPKNLTLYWRVRTNGANGPSVWSEVRSFISANSPSMPKLSLPANNALITNHLPLFKWSRVTVPALSTFKHYQLQVDNDADFSSPVIDDTSITNQSITQFQTLSVLDTNTKFYWRVRGVNTDDEVGNWSTVRYFRTAILPPAVTAPLDGATGVPRMPLLDWENVPGNSGYVLQVWKVGTTPTLVKSVTLATNVSQYQFLTNLLPSTAYYWRVQTKAVNGPSLWTENFDFTTGP